MPPTEPIRASKPKPAPRVPSL
uniref:Uncharacterized protein n=1 Tax=Arundo donax TaxID=35708 RepID=A0A0A9FYH1_ARUDO